jgi:hypothetical protein
VTYADIFARLGKLTAVYDNLIAVSLRVKSGVCTVRGLGGTSAFGFSCEVAGECADFSFITETATLSPFYSFTVSGISVREDGNLDIAGTFGSGERALSVQVVCAAAGEAVSKRAAALEARIADMVDSARGNVKICDIADNILTWLAISKCGGVSLTSDLAYALGASASAFCARSEAYNIEREKVIQIDSTYPAQLHAVQTVCGAADLALFQTGGGAVFVAASADRQVFAISGGVAAQKHTLPRAKKLFSDAAGFSTVELRQSAVRDILTVVADKMTVDIDASASGIGFTSGARGVIKLPESVEIDCDCLASRDHAVRALDALPDADRLIFGYGWSGCRTFLSLESKGVLILIPAQDSASVA